MYKNSRRARTAALAVPTNDKEQVAPMVAKVQDNPEGLNRPATRLADTGY